MPPAPSTVHAPADPDAARPALRVADLRLAFGGLRALDGVSFDVRRGAITALIGPNGAGKTTAFNVVSGLLRADSGEVTFEGRPIAGLPPERIAALGLTRSFQIARGFPKLSVFEHLMVYGPRQPGERWLASLVGSTAARRHEARLAEGALAVARRLRLERVIDHRVGELSGGQKKLLEIGRALMAEPRLLLLDEPSMGLAPRLVAEIFARVAALKAEGTTILLVDQNAAAALALADRGYVMEGGHIVLQGAAAELLHDPQVRQAYMGL